MSRRAKILRNIAIGLAALIAIVVVALIVVVRTDWFRDYVKRQIVTAAEDGTGGKVEIGSFSFGWWPMRAVLTDLVIHGNEPPGSAPYLGVRRAEVDLRLLTSLKHMLDVTYLGLDGVQANIMVFPDGTTNVPEPKQKSTSNKTPLETIVDLAVGRFELTNGWLTFNSRKQPLDVKGNNLRVQLLFDALKQSYTGEVSLQPLYIASGRNTPVQFTITLPLAFERDRIAFQNAKISTAASEILINGSMENLRDPKTAAHITGHLALADLKNAADLPLDVSTRNAPANVDLDANATMAGNVIDVSGLKVSLGHSEIEASGKLKDNAGRGSLQFKMELALAELGRLAKVAARPAGTVSLYGTARLDANNEYEVVGNLHAKDVSVQQGAPSPGQKAAQRTGNINLVSAVEFNPRRLELNGIHLSAYGAELTADASLENFERYKLNGNLRRLDLRTAAGSMGQTNLPYDGAVTGTIAAEGDLKTPDAKSLAAHARLSITPVQPQRPPVRKGPAQTAGVQSGQRSIPVSGRLNADYEGKNGNINIGDSYIALPHTRLNLSGSLGNRLSVTLSSRDLNDLLAATGSTAPIALNGGQANLAAVVTGSLSSPHVTGHLAMNQFVVEGRQFDSLALDLAGSSSRAAISNGSLDRGAMQTRFAAAVGLKNWDPAPNQPLTVTASVRNGDLADIMALAGQAPANAAPPKTGSTNGAPKGTEQAAVYSGALSADANVTGTIANPRGTASLNVLNGTVQGQPFDTIQVQVNMADQLVTIPAAYIAAGASRVNLTAEFHHPRESFSEGRLHAHVQSNQVDLAKLNALQQRQPGPAQNTAGLLQINADVNGNLTETDGAGTPSGKRQIKAQSEEQSRDRIKVPSQEQGKGQSEFLLTNVNADISARGVRFEGQNYGDFNATARTNGQDVNYNVTSDFAGSDIRVTGNTRLARGYPTTADANIAHLPVERALAAAKKTDIPARGNLSGTAHVSGTMENPEGNVNLDLANAVVYDEPIDRVRARVTYLTKSIDVAQFEIQSGPTRLELTAHYDHTPGNLQTGNLRFNVNSSRIDLARIRNIQKARPGMGGTLQLTANGAATVCETEPYVLLHDLNTNLAATGIAVQGKNFGDLTLKANTNTTGGRVDFALDSNLASASIHGNGNAQLSGDYPVTAQLAFNNVAWTKLQPLLGTGGTERSNFEASTDGHITLSGPATKTNDLRASLQLTRVQFNTLPETAATKAVVIQNQGPVTVSLDHGVAKLENLHLSGPQTEIRAGGTVSLQAQTVDANLNANTNLGLLQQLDRDVVSSGNIVLAAAVKGSMSKPLVNGRLEIQNASLNYTEIPNGITNANGTVLFNGSNASVQNLTGEVGGGKLDLGGFVAYSDAMRFGLRANATNVRMRLQQGVSAVADANIRLTGGMQASTVSGTVTINQITYAPQSDFGSILSRSAPPVQAPATPSPVLDNMKLDVQVRTSPGLAVQASQAQNLQADANLRIRGTASQPGVLGRITITEGELVFFSSTYTVNSGTVSFFNPIRIEPILDVSLETQAKGVDVVLRVTGPVDNMKLSYTSDPPLQFQEIVSLLASGKTPTSDPTILANQPSPPPQSFEQMGESALMSKALADPVASRLQRVFGVSQLKIDPSFTSGSDLPQAKLTLQQQVANNLTFTYITAMNDPNSQIIRVEWSPNQQWSAMAVRDQNGMFSLRFLYKKRFR